LFEDLFTSSLEVKFEIWGAIRSGQWPSTQNLQSKMGSSQNPETAESICVKEKHPRIWNTVWATKRAGIKLQYPLLKTINRGSTWSIYSGQRLLQASLERKLKRK